MATGTYLGASSVAHKTKKMYIGNGSVAKTLKKGYIGSGGVAHTFWTGGQGDYSKLAMLTQYRVSYGKVQLLTSSDSGLTWTIYPEYTDLSNLGAQLQLAGYKDGFLYFGRFKYEYVGEPGYGYYQNKLWTFKMSTEDGTGAVTVVRSGEAIPYCTDDYFSGGSYHINQSNGEIYFAFLYSSNPSDWPATQDDLYYVRVDSSAALTRTLISWAGYYDQIGTPGYDYGWVGGYGYYAGERDITVWGPGQSDSLPTSGGTVGPVAMTGRPNSFGFRVKVNGGSGVGWYISTNKPYVKRGKGIQTSNYEQVMDTSGSYDDGGYSTTAHMMMGKYLDYLYEYYYNSWSSGGSYGSGTYVQVRDANTLNWIYNATELRNSYSTVFLPLQDRLIIGNKYTLDGLTVTVNSNWPTFSPDSNGYSYQITGVTACVNGGGYFYW